MFNHPINFFPLSNFTKPNISILVTISDEQQSQKYADFVTNAVKDMANVQTYVIPYDLKSVNLICTLCEDSECAADWLLHTPEYFASRLIKTDLNLVILPEFCPANFRYGSDKIAFAVENDKDGIEAAIKSSLFGIDVNTENSPFEELIYHRNMLLKPLHELLSNITAVIEGIHDIFHLSLDFTEQETLNILDNNVQMFKTKQDAIIDGFFGGDDITALFNETKQIVDQSWNIWSRISETVKLKRICVSNQIDVSKDPFILSRPSFYAIASIISSICIFIYVFSRMKPKTVVRIISAPSPLL